MHSAVHFGDINSLSGTKMAATAAAGSL